MRCGRGLILYLFILATTPSFYACYAKISPADTLFKKRPIQKKMTEFSVDKTDEQWMKQLGEEAFRVLRKKGTEPSFSSEYETFWEPGIYVCKGCDAELFSSNTKFDAGCGWPSFYQSIDKTKVREIEDISYNMSRVEVVCNACGGHLGHVFSDGFGQPGGLRYCINGVSLGFKKKE